MYKDDDFIYGLNEVQQIILDKIKKDISGLSVKEAKEILYKTLNDIEDETIISSRS